MYMGARTKHPLHPHPISINDSLRFLVFIKNLQITCKNLLCIGCGLISGFGLTYGVNDVAGVNGGVGFPGTGLC